MTNSAHRSILNFDNFGRSLSTSGNLDCFPRSSIPDALRAVEADELWQAEITNQSLTHLRHAQTLPRNNSGPGQEVPSRPAGPVRSESTVSTGSRRLRSVRVGFDFVYGTVALMMPAGSKKSTRSWATRGVF